MSDEASSLSIEQLLEVERICDRYEADCRRLGQQPTEGYLDAVEEPVRTRARAELSRLAREFSTYAAPRHERTFHQPDRKLLGETPLSTPLLRGDRFEIHGRLGVGGSATVWRAFDRQLNRWVALKAPHADEEFDKERFQRESQVVARLQHPRIVRLLDTGQDEYGWFMISELIDGDSLADRIKQTALTDAEIATLVAEVADAVHYAHGMGVVHRDLKPQNILLDKQGGIYITDFGLARPWKQTSALENADTGVFGTPAYMAPEQVEGEADRVEPRTDVYALGVILFQLLTGELPFRGGVEGVLQQILQHDPTAPRLLRRDVPVDLETLCLKCLEKVPHKRIASAELLAIELRRFVRHEPIQSRPLGMLGRVTKLARRNPGPAKLVATILALVLLVAAVSVVASLLVTGGWNREVRLRHVAEQARTEAESAARSETQARKAAIEALAQTRRHARRAEEEAELSRQSLEFLESVLQAADPVSWVLDSQFPSVREPPEIADMLDTAAARVSTEFAQQPRIQSRLMDTIAMGYRGVGRYADAIHLLEASRLVRAEIPNDDAALSLEINRNRFYRAMIHQDLGERTIAIEIYREVLESLASDVDKDHQLTLADVEFQLGWALVAGNEHEESKLHFSRALAIRERFFPPNSSAVKAARVGLEMAGTSNLEDLSLERLTQVVEGDDRISQMAGDYIAMLGFRRLGQYEQAAEAYRRVLEKLERLMSDQHPLFVLALGDYADLLWRQGDFQQALPAIQRAIAIAEQLAPAHPKLQHAREKLALELMRAGRFDEAEAQFRKMLEREEADGQFSWNAHEGLIWLCQLQGNRTEALRHARQLVEHSDRSFKRAWAYFALALVHEGRGEQEAFAEALQASLKEIEGGDPLPDRAIWHERIAGILQHQREYEAALAFQRDALRFDQAEFPADHPHIADRRLVLAGTLRNLGRTEESIVELRAALAILEAKLPPDDARTARARDSLAQLQETHDASVQ